MNISRRSVIQGLGALALTPLLPAIAAFEESTLQPTQRNPHFDTLEDFFPRVHPVDFQKRLDYESLARKCLQLRVGDSPSVVTDSIPTPLQVSHIMSHAELNPYDTSIMNAACDRFLRKEEQIFGQLLQRSFVLNDTYVMSGKPAPDLFARVRDRIEWKRIPVDKILICEEDLEALESRWVDTLSYDKVRNPVLRECGFRGSIFGMSVITRKDSPILKRNEAIMMTAPEYLGVFRDLSWDVGVGHSIEETWTNRYDMVLNKWGAYRVVFENL